MNRIAKFEKVSYEQFKKDWLNTFSYKYFDMDEEEIDVAIHKIYDSIKLPKRATSGSAGYDFFCPCNLVLAENGSLLIPTGIKCYIEKGWVLKAYPRSSYGFKYYARLANTVGIIDEDYYNNTKNEGHIFIKLVGSTSINIKKDDAFCQGLFMLYGITYDDDVSEVRTGGIGSTGS